MTRKISEILDAAADLISEPGAWARKCLNYAGAIDASGDAIAAHSTDAAAWSGLAAIFRASGAVVRANALPCNYAKLAYDNACPSYDADAWERHPDRTQPEVVAKLREAAALARKQEAGHG